MLHFPFTKVSIVMLHNYFTIGWRNLLRHKGYSFINIGGLALGLTVALLIGLWVRNELSHDRYHANYDRIVNAMQHGTTGGVRRTTGVIPMPLEAELRTKYGNDFEYISLITWQGDHILTYGDRNLAKVGSHAQPDFPEMFSIKMIKGNYEAFHNPASILLSEPTAIALFGSVDVLNEIIVLDNKQEARVVGVYESLPRNTTFHNLEFIGGWDLYMASSWPKGPNQNWNDNFIRLYAQLAPNTSVNVVSEKIKNIKADQLADKSQRPEIFLNPMGNWYLRSDWKDGVNTGGRIQTVWMVGTIGAFVLMLACVNFINLSTARAEKRSKEVGIRLTIGSMRRQLIAQFLSESFLVVSISFLIAIASSILLMPWFNELTDKNISVDLFNPYLWLAGVSLIVITGFIAGWYPALYLSSLRPVRAIRASRLATLPRKFLVVFQFTISVCLAIGTIVVYQQIQFTMNRPLGYDQDRLISISMKSPDFKGKLDVIRTMLKNAGAIEEMAQSSSPVTNVWNMTNEFQWPGKDPAKNNGLGTIFITPDYGETIGWTIVDGRDVSNDIGTDSLAMILNEAAVKYMDVKDPVGMEIVWGPRKYHVVGIVKDMIAESPYSPVNPAIYMVREQRSNFMFLKLASNNSAQRSLAIIESVYKQVIPAVPFDFKFIDDEYARKFDSERRIGSLTLVFTTLAIVISCLGLFGLASFVASQKVKEIGIRKVLGASVRSLWQLLSRDFVVLVLIAFFVAVPLSSWFMNNWLARYQYRTPLSWNVFILVGFGAILVTVITVSVQTIKAAMTNPVKSLRSE